MSQQGHRGLPRVAVIFGSYYKSIAPATLPLIRANLIDVLRAEALVLVTRGSTDRSNDSKIRTLVTAGLGQDAVGMVEVETQLSSLDLAALLEGVPHFQRLVKTLHCRKLRSGQAHPYDKGNVTRYACEELLRISSGNVFLAPVLGSPSLNTLRELYMQSRLLQLISTQELVRRGGLQYEAIVWSRLEYTWLRPAPYIFHGAPLLKSVDGDCVWVPAEEDHAGINDRHAYMNRRHADVYLTRFGSIINASRLFGVLPCLRHGPCALSSEKFLAALLAHHQVRICRTPPVAHLACCHIGRHLGSCSRGECAAVRYPDLAEPTLAFERAERGSAAAASTTSTVSEGAAQRAAESAADVSAAASAHRSSAQGFRSSRGSATAAEEMRIIRGSCPYLRTSGKYGKELAASAIHTAALGMPGARLAIANRSAPYMGAWHAKLPKGPSLMVQLPSNRSLRSLLDWLDGGREATSALKLYCLRCPGYGLKFLLLRVSGVTGAPEESRRTNVSRHHANSSRGRVRRAPYYPSMSAAATPPRKIAHQVSATTKITKMGSRNGRNGLALLLPPADRHRDCRQLVPRPIDASPIRSPQAVHTALLKYFRGKEISEIGTRNGDGMLCFASVASRAVAIELDPAYCAALRERSRLNVDYFDVVCSDYRSPASAAAIDADYITWWQQPPHLHNARALDALSRMQRRGILRRGALAAMVFDRAYAKDARDLRRYLPHAVWHEKVAVDEHALCCERSASKCKGKADKSKCARATGTFDIMAVPLNLTGRDGNASAWELPPSNKHAPTI